MVRSAKSDVPSARSENRGSELDRGISRDVAYSRTFEIFVVDPSGRVDI
jgi:hypothetical protein